MKINIKIFDSIRDMSYTAALPQIAGEFENKFKGGGIFEIELCEHISHDGKWNVYELEISDDGMELKGKIYFNRYWKMERKKTVLTPIPKPAEVYSDIKNYLNNAVIEYNKKFPKDI